jgi:hypothetical protein
MKKCEACQTALAAAMDVDDAWHGLQGLTGHAPLDNALKRLCLALELYTGDGKPKASHLQITDLMQEGIERGHTCSRSLKV